MTALASIRRWQRPVVRRCWLGISAVVLAAIVIMSATPSSTEPLSAAPPFETRIAVLDLQGRADETPAAIARVPEVPSEKLAPSTAPSLVPDARARYRALVEKAARDNGLAPEIAEAVMAVESGYNPGAIGGAGEIGLMQILPSTARMLGFSGTLSDLAVPETNIHYGVAYLAQAWRLAGGDLCTAVMKYRAGHGETRFSFLSVNYCLAVRSKLAARGFPVTGSVPVATFGEAGRGCGRRCLSGGTGGVNIAALNKRLSALVVQVRGGR
jgi:soluble lytic murein transglycosylase-like protein